MELITTGIILVLIIVLGSALFYSFLDKETLSASKNAKHLKGQRKLYMQDGMVAMKSSKSQPLFVIGDSKVIR